MSLQTRLNALISAIANEFNTRKNVYYCQVWGEESGNLSAGTAGGYQYSYGNGETGATGGVAIYVPSGYIAEIVAMTFCSKGNSTGVVDLTINGVEQGVNMSVAATAQATEVFDLATPIGLASGDKITFHTISTSSAADGNVVTAVIRFTEQ